MLAIMGLVLSLVGARMIGNIESQRFIRTAEAAVADVLIIRADAILNAEPRTLITQSRNTGVDERREFTRRFDIPQDWRVEGDNINISASGVCSGGLIAFTNSQGRRIVYRLDPPRCTAQRLSLGT